MDLTKYGAVSLTATIALVPLILALGDLFGKGHDYHTCTSKRRRLRWAFIELGLSNACLVGLWWWGVIMSGLAHSLHAVLFCIILLCYGFWHIASFWYPKLRILQIMKLLLTLLVVCLCIVIALVA